MNHCAGLKFAQRCTNLLQVLWLHIHQEVRSSNMFSDTIFFLNEIYSNWKTDPPTSTIYCCLFFHSHSSSCFFSICCCCTCMLLLWNVFISICYYFWDWRISRDGWEGQQTLKSLPHVPGWNSSAFRFMGTLQNGAKGTGGMCGPFPGSDDVCNPSSIGNLKW